MSRNKRTFQGVALRENPLEDSTAAKRNETGEVRLRSQIGSSGNCSLQSHLSRDYGEVRQKGTVPREGRTQDVGQKGDWLA